MTSNIVFIGLGNMGLPMAQNLVRAGHAVTGFDLVPASVRQFADGGGLVSDDQAAAIQAADIVITMLPASRHVLGAYLGDAGILAQARPGTLLIDCSTISTEAARQVGRAAQEKGLPMLDAPVSGGTAGATNGTLTFMVGGEESALAAARPYLEIMGKAIFHAGGSGCPGAHPWPASAATAGRRASFVAPQCLAAATSATGRLQWQRAGPALRWRAH